MDDIITKLREINSPITVQAADELSRFQFLTKNPIQVTRYTLGDIHVTQQPNGSWSVSRLGKYIAQDGTVWNEATMICQFPLHAALRIAQREREKDADHTGAGS